MTGEQAYLTSQLPAYIGNKRRLIPFLQSVFTQLCSQLPQDRPLRFLDAFAGTGAVSRLGKSLGMQVHANDWEPYSQLFCRAYLGYDAADLQKHEPQFTQLRRRLNQMYYSESLRCYENPSDQPGYIQRLYAPFCTEDPKIGQERLFYTQENARFIDAVRDFIADHYPQPGTIYHDLLLALLLYEAATHANTSGVFKAYHRGFGGLGRDALSRIIVPMSLEPPQLIDRPETKGLHVVTGLDAQEAANQAGRVDITYLDPPYNIHQYGSNYFMLNSITRWDKPDIPLLQNSQGELLKKAGIRGDWIATRSDYCSPSRAARALESLLDSISSRFIVVSYNTEGVIPFQGLLDLLSRYGSVKTEIQPYTTYRGGRQSPNRSIGNHELVLVVDSQGSPGRLQIQGLTTLEQRRRADRLSRGVFLPEQMRKSNLQKALLDRGLHLLSDCVFSHPLETASELAASSAPEELLSALESLYVEDFRQRVGILRTALLTWRGGELGKRSANRTRLQNLLIASLRKFAFRKYREDYHSWYTKLQEDCNSADTTPGLKGLSKKLTTLDQRVRSRM